jgi:hypothetical protein
MGTARLGVEFQAAKRLRFPLRDFAQSRHMPHVQTRRNFFATLQRPEMTGRVAVGTATRACRGHRAALGNNP